MMNHNRRAFLADVGKGMLVASVGPSLAAELGISRAFAEEGATRLTFGDREPLVGLLQDTPANKLLPILVEKLNSGTSINELVASAALANARTFGGQDYDGYHAFMALLPALQMSKELPKERQALPVLKVLYRNTTFMQSHGGSKKEMLHPVAAGELPKDRSAGEALRESTRKKDINAAESTFAAIAKSSPGEAYNDLQFSIQDELNVHRVVLAWRSWAVLDLVGKEHAHTLLRQSVRFCACENHDNNIRVVLPKMFDQYKLLGKSIGTRKADDAWIEKMSQMIYASDGAKAADAVAAALAEGMSPEAIGEAMSLAANRYVLCDPGRPKKGVPAHKPEGSVHGDSVGVHVSDSVNAWRSIARVTDARNTFASLIVGAYHTATRNGQYSDLLKQPHPLPELLEKITAKDADALLREAEGAIKDKDQARAAALVHRYGELGFPERPVFDLMLKFACSEDGALHAEKYYRTVAEEFATMRPAFRWRELVALARVTASEFGWAAPGYAEACKLLKV